MARARAHSRKREEKDETDGEAKGRGGRALWNGSVSFGLLQIPVGLHTAEQRSEEIHFRQLDKKSLAPIKYERVSSKTGKAVAWGDIVKGYEYEKDNFVVLDADDLAKANVKASQTIEIQDFVPFDQIDPAFFDTPYYLVPQKRAEKAYVLLRDALAKKGAVAIATFVLRTREHLCAVMPDGDALLLETLRFGHELKSPDELPVPSKASAGARELAMAEQLVESMTVDWKPAKYKDRWHDDVMKVIEEKAKTGKITAHHEEKAGEVATNVTDLLELLKKSVAANSNQKAKPGPKKAAHRRKKAA